MPSRGQAIPKYFRISREIIHSIRTGDLAPGAVLPSENEIIGAPLRFQLRPGVHIGGDVDCEVGGAGGERQQQKGEEDDVHDAH